MSGEGRDLDPLSVVRAWLDAPFERASDFLTGPVRDHALLRAGVESTSSIAKRPPVIRSLALREHTDLYAVCDLDADLTYDLSGPAGQRASVTRPIGGPVVLGRTPDGWRLADFTVGGRRAVESTRVYSADARVDLDRFAVTPLALTLSDVGTQFLFDVANHGADEIAVRGVGAPTGGLMRSRWTFVDGRRTIGPGETVRLESQADQVLPLSTPVVKLAMPVKPAKGRIHLVRLTLPFANRDAAPRVKARKLLGLTPRQAWAINAVVVLLIVVLLGRPDWLPWP